MKVDVKTIDNRKKGDIELADSVFGIEPRADVVARVVHSFSIIFAPRLIASKQASIPIVWSL